MVAECWAEETFAVEEVEAVVAESLLGAEVAACHRGLFALGQEQEKACYSAVVQGAAVAAAGVRVVGLHTGRTLRSSSLLARENQVKASAAHRAHKPPGSCSDHTAASALVAADPVLAHTHPAVVHQCSCPLSQTQLAQ